MRPPSSLGPCRTAGAIPVPASLAVTISTGSAIVIVLLRAISASSVNVDMYVKATLWDPGQGEQVFLQPRASGRTFPGLEPEIVGQADIWFNEFVGNEASRGCVDVVDLVLGVGDLTGSE